MRVASLDDQTRRRLNLVNRELCDKIVPDSARLRVAMRYRGIPEVPGVDHGPGHDSMSDKNPI